MVGGLIVLEKEIYNKGWWKMNEIPENEESMYRQLFLETLLRKKKDEKN